MLNPKVRVREKQDFFFPEFVSNILIFRHTSREEAGVSRQRWKWFVVSTGLTFFVNVNQS